MENAAEARLYFEDLQPGQRFSSGKHRIDAVEIKAFAAQFDPQPFHLDETTAQDTFFGGLAASGWHTAAVTMRLLVSGGMPIAGGITVPGATSAGRAPPGRAMSCGLNRWWRGWCRRGRGPTAAW